MTIPIQPPAPAGGTGRATCAVCMRPTVVCVCPYVQSVETRTRVLLLQHPRERDVAVNTVRIAALCLPSATVRVGVDFACDPVVTAALADPERPAVLLFPGPGSHDLRTDPPRGEVTLVVLDGTWWQAAKLLKSNPAVAALPRYAFAPEQPSRYRIRREPAEHCVATIEALAQALGLLEGDPARMAPLLRPFEAMVERQLEYASREHHGRARVRKPRPANRARPTPAVLRERPGDVVLAYGEANAWPYGTPDAPPHEVIHWAAVRPATGERFEAVVAPRYPLADSFAYHTGITLAEARAGETFEAFRTRWEIFVREADVLCTWGVYAADVLAAQGVALPPRVDLRTAAAVYLASRPGALEDCPARMGTVTEAPWARGRSGERLAALTAVARVLAGPSGPRLGKRDADEASMAVTDDPPPE